MGKTGIRINYLYFLKFWRGGEMSIILIQYNFFSLFKDYLSARSFTLSFYQLLIASLKFINK